MTTLNVLAEKAALLKTKLFAKSNILKLDVSDNKEADILEAGESKTRSLWVKNT